MATTIPHGLLLELLQRTFGTKTELLEFSIANQASDYFVLLARLRHPSLQVVIKLAGPGSPMASRFDRTAMLHRLVSAQSTIPMPETLAVNMDLQAWPWRYFIRTHIPGLEWAVVRQQMDVNELSNAYQQIGEAVARLHTIHFNNWGELAADGSVSGSSNYRSALAEHARCIIKPVRSRELFLGLLEKNKNLFQDFSPACLCHEDLHQHNILFDHHGGKWRLAAILDFDKAWAGDHETDLARLEFWTGMVSPAFWPAYTAICPIDPLYELRRPIYQLLWCFEFARPTEAHLAGTQRLCAELGLPLFERFD